MFTLCGEQYRCKAPRTLWRSVMMKSMRAAGLIVLGMLMLAACQSGPASDGRYATPSRGGWGNFRAEAPPTADAQRSPGM